jgi:hypothetical protein
MGYIQQSDTKKIYAYLTQLGKEKIISGDTIDFQIKYFSLHDDDINYGVASKTSGLTYNIPKSGFIPNITGDNNLCLPNISDATFLKANILFDEIIILEPTYTITPDKNIIYENDIVTFTIETKNVNNGTVLNWTNIGTTIASDFVENTINGNVTIISDRATFSLKVKYDTITETDGESIIIVLKNQTGNILATAPQVVVNDLPPLQGGVMTPCLNNGTSKIRISIFLPSGGGGAGGPYKWRAVPIDSNGNLIYPYDGPTPNIYSTRSITETYDFPTEYNNSNVFYNIYLIDSQGNEGLINTTTTTCSIAPTGSLILTVEPTNIALGGAVGSYDLIGTNILQEPSQNFDFIATLTKSDNSPITLQEQNSVSFKLTKDLNFDIHVDITNQFGPFSDTTVYSFANNVIKNQTNTFIQKKINLKAIRNSNVLLKPASNSFAQTRPFSIKLKLNTVTGGPTVQNDTLTIDGYKWIWI